MWASGSIARLIQAIKAAEANGEAHTITCKADTCTLAAVENSPNGPNGLPSMTSPLTILGVRAEGATMARVTCPPLARCGSRTAPSPTTLSTSRVTSHAKVGYRYDGQTVR